MAWEIKDIEVEALGTVKRQKYEVYDIYGEVGFVMSGVTYEFVKQADGVAVLSGSGWVNNSDTDGAGNSIKTVTIPLDLDSTNIAAGTYYLVWTITLTDGQTDKGRAYYRVRNFNERY